MFGEFDGWEVGMLAVSSALVPRHHPMLSRSAEGPVKHTHAVELKVGCDSASDAKDLEKSEL